MHPLPDPVALGKVAVLMGGRSAERDISLQSGQAVLQALRSRGVDAHGFDPARDGLETLKAQGFARCFIALHGRQGEDGTVQGALELLGLPYTGSGVLASSLAMDKAMTKHMWGAHQLPTPPWHLARSAREARQALGALGAPMIVKPAREGSTLGLSKISSAQEAEAAYALAARMDARVLCEAFVAGLELTCALLENADGSVQALPLIRIQAPGGNYDYHNKYFGHATRYHCPSGLPAPLEAHIQHLCVRAWQALGCRGWARADIMLRASDQQPFLLEINTSPGMTDHSLVPMAARASGMDYASLCLRIAATARLENPESPPQPPLA